MDTTPPEVTLLVKDKPTQEKLLMIVIYDATEFTITGFTEPGCKILADEVDYSTGNVKFEAKFKVSAAPSKTDHDLVIIDKFKNETKIKINGVNNHEKVVKLKIESKSAIIDGKEVQMIVPIKIINGSTMIPMRFMVQEILDGTATYNVQTKTVIIFANDIEVKVQIAVNKALIDGKEVKITPPTVYNGSTMLPLRFFGETFGFKVVYVNETKTITLSILISPTK
jgi:hypothetical protein